MSKYLTTGGIVLALILGVLGVTRATPEKVTEVVREIGANSGTDHYQRHYFAEGLTVGKRVATTTGVATYTTSAKDFAERPTYWDVTPNVITTITITASSTLTYIPNVGDVAEIYVRNATSTAAAGITLAAGSNVDLQKDEDVGDLAFLGLDWARLTLIRESDNLVTIFYTELTEAD